MVHPLFELCIYLTYSAHFHILSLIWSSYVYFYHKVYLHIIHIYSSSLIKGNQRNFHRHCISISYNPILSKPLLPLAYRTYSFATIVNHSGSFLWLLLMYMHQWFSENLSQSWCFCLCYFSEKYKAFLPISKLTTFSFFVIFASCF